MSRREKLGFAIVLAGCVAGLLHESLFEGKILSSSDVLASAWDETGRAQDALEPGNRLLVDPALQFEPWLEFNRRMIRAGRLPLWNSAAGCGAPHLANGQSAVFDPFHVIAYMGDAASTRGLIAALRLFTAGMGMFLLAGSWGLERAGRWFAGLVFPFSGFLIVWLLYPVAWAAIWTPWLLRAVDRALDRRDPRSAGWLALAAALTILGGHIQTSAHVLLLAAAYALWRAGPRRLLTAAAPGLALGCALAAIQVIPLACYLGKSSVWSDREAERVPCWKLDRPRLLDLARLAAPAIYGGQQRGQPNLGRALGAENVNESAGGYAGLATLIWLAPLALAGQRVRQARFLLCLAVFAVFASFKLPPVDNLLRALPVLAVTDNRRMTLYIAFALALLGGMGLDRLAFARALPRVWLCAWCAAAMVLLAGAGVIRVSEPWIRGQIERRLTLEIHTLDAAADAAAIERKTETRTREVVRFIPRYYAWTAAELLALAALAFTARRPRHAQRIQPIVFCSVMVDLALFSALYNPAVERSTYTKIPHALAPLLARLGPHDRVIGLDDLLPPNTAMRYGLNDPRNYDSIELARAVHFLNPLFQPGRTAAPSRREITWDTIPNARSTLAQACVRALVSHQEAPDSPGPVEPSAGLVITWLDALPFAHPAGSNTPLSISGSNGDLQAKLDLTTDTDIFIHETWDSGWRGEIDGKPALIRPFEGTFMAVHAPAGSRVLRLKYDPIEVKIALAVSLAGLLLTILVLTRNRLF